MICSSEYVKDLLKKSFTKFKKTFLPNKPTIDKISESPTGELLFDGNPIGGGAGDIYSEDEEVVIGKWTDRRPIYRKKLILSTGGYSAGWGSINITGRIPDVDRYIGARVFSPDYNFSVVGCCIIDGAHYIGMPFGMASTSSKKYAFVDYTKKG